MRDTCILLVILAKPERAVLSCLRVLHSLGHVCNLCNRAPGPPGHVRRSEVLSSSPGPISRSLRLRLRFTYRSPWRHAGRRSQTSQDRLTGAFTMPWEKLGEYGVVADKPGLARPDEKGFSNYAGVILAAGKPVAEVKLFLTRLGRLPCPAPTGSFGSPTCGPSVTG